MRFFPAFASASSLWLLFAAAPLRAEEPLCAVDPSTVTAGWTLSIVCRATAPWAGAAFLFHDRETRFYKTRHRQWRARTGIFSMEPPGEKAGVVKISFASGAVVESTVPFTVQDGTYPVSHVALSPQKDNLITAGSVEKDGETLSAFYSRPGSPRKYWSGAFVWPSTGVVSSVFGARRSYGNRLNLNPHTGLDIANTEGTPVHAANGGVVVFADWLTSFGNVVMIDHGQGVYSYYLHMKERRVKKGQRVKKGRLIGLMGQEGLATGPHVHWSLAVAGERVEPREWADRDVP